MGRIGEFDEVVVGVDFGPGGDAAVALAGRLVSPDGRMTLTNIVPSDPTVFRGQRDDRVAAEQARSLSLLDRERSLVRLQHRDGLPARVETCALIAASTGRGLHAVAERLRADLVVMGEPRHAGLGRALLGDDLRRVLRGASWAVAVAPRGYAGEQALRRVGVAGGEPLRELAALSRQLDLLVVEPQAEGRRPPGERLARLAACPLLVLPGGVSAAGGLARAAGVG